MVKHSYILELKYLPQSATKEKAEAQWAEAIEQIKAYTQGEKVKSFIQGPCIPLWCRLKGMRR